MKKILIAAVALMGLAGCSTTRFVTTQTWVGADTLYVAYTEYTQMIFSSTFDAKVMKCLRAQSNAMACSPEDQINKLLNEGSWTASK